MSRLTPAARERLLEILADRATQGLAPLEEAELNTLLAEARGDGDAPDPSLDLGFDWSLDLTAAAYELSCLEAPLAAMPADVRDRLLASGEAWCRGEREPAAGPVGFVGPGAARPVGTPVLPWLAAAAGLALAAVAWIGRPATPIASPPPVAAVEPSMEEQRLALLARDPAAMQAPVATWDPATPGVGGDVVWSESEQRGYLHLTGVLPNDPALEQYQAWLVDERGMEQRVSVALFDVPASGEVIVPLDPRIRVRNAVVIAVTGEKPGGTWVSDLSRKIAIAQKKG